MLLGISRGDVMTGADPRGDDHAAAHTVERHVPTAVHSHRRRARILSRVLLIAGDVSVLLVSFGAAAWLRMGRDAPEAMATMMAVMIPIYLGTALNSNAFDLDSIRAPGLSIRRALSALFFTMIALALVVFFLKASDDVSRLVFGFGSLLATAGIAVERWLVINAAKPVIGANPYVELVITDDVAIDMRSDVPQIDAAAYGLTPDPGDPSSVQRLGEFVRDVDRVIIACPPERRQAWAFLLKAVDIRAEIIAPELETIGAVDINHIGGQRTITISTGPLAIRHRIAKRVFDLAVVLFVLPFLAIPMLVTVLAIRLESPGPVLFRQSRIGLGNRPFRILKFRSMRVERSDAAGAQSAARDDERVTRVGRFIRKTSIDELPQLLNVLWGDMSIVGPRPHAIGSRAENLLFWDIDDRYWHRHAVKPGLTGLAQVRGYRGATEAREDLSNRLIADLEYRANWSLMRDISILFATFRVLVHRNAF